MRTWQSIESAPKTGATIEVKTEGGKRLLALWKDSGFMDEQERDCGSWVAAVEGKHPRCWTDGACWASNSNEVPSDPPSAWRPAPGDSA